MSRVPVCQQHKIFDTSCQVLDILRSKNLSLFFIWRNERRHLLHLSPLFTNHAACLIHLLLSRRVCFPRPALATPVNTSHATNPKDKVAHSFPNILTSFWVKMSNYPYLLACVGLQWSNSYSSPIYGDTASFGWLCWLMLIDSLLYFVIGAYIRMVFPGNLQKLYLNSDVGKHNEITY